jgi:hypothetical protein
VDVQLRLTVPKTMLYSRHDAQRCSYSVAELRDWLEEETRDRDCADGHPRSSSGSRKQISVLGSHRTTCREGSEKVAAQKVWLRSPCVRFREKVTKARSLT